MKYRYRDPHEMKESGVEWLGMIPKEWGVEKIQSHFNIRREKVSDKEFKALSVTKNGIVPQLENVAKTDNGDSRKKVLVGDFVINSRADRKKSCGVSNYDGSVSLICHILVPRETVVPNYIHHLFRNYYFSEEFFRWGTGIVADLWSTNIERMKKISIPINNEQQKIANFLDQKTSEFDSIIEKKEKLIERLEEAEKSLISEVVTGKKEVISNKKNIIDEDGQEKEMITYVLRNRESHEMKESGVEWLGMIPKKWGVSKLKYNFKFLRGLPITKADLRDKGIQCLNYGEIHSKYSRFINTEKNELKKVSEEYLKTNNNSLLKNGDLVFADTSEDLKGSGNFTYIGGNKTTFAGYHTITIRTNSDKPNKYLAYLFDSMDIRKQIQLKVKGVKVYSITQNILKEIYIFKSNEENKIANFLDQKTLEFDSIIEKNKKIIEKIKEAKQSLISEAVTGKIEILD